MHRRDPVTTSRRALCAVTALALGACADPTPIIDDRPNILLIVADDLGYADLGVYGSDIRTPNIDALAAEGVLFTQFHTAPMCAPSRAMLLTGNNNHVAGMGLQSASGLITHVPGYEAHLSDRVAPMPRLLRDSGYHTYMAGKWHMGSAMEDSPTAAGFERTYNLAHGAGSHYSATGFFEGGSVYRADGEPTEWPAGAYSTELFTDKLIEFIDSNPDDGRPFFAFGAYTSPHWPLQVPDDYLDAYAGAYDGGYDRLRELNFEKLMAAGILAEGHELPPRNPAITPWDALDGQTQRIEARKMELYAAMVENLDFHVGRLLDHLRETGKYENTLVIFMSDNGAAAEDFYNGVIWPEYMDFVRANYDNSLENMGKPSSWVSYGAQWAEAGSAPFARHKGYATEGGITTPLIMAGPGVSRRGEIDRGYLTIMDLAPTFLEVADTPYPSDGSVEPMLGASLVDLLAGRTGSVHPPDYTTTLFHRGRAFIRQGDWKLVTFERPFDESAFQLFDLSVDPGETNNLRQAEPEQFQHMLELWRVKRIELGILLPSDL